MNIINITIIINSFDKNGIKYDKFNKYKNVIIPR